MGVLQNIILVVLSIIFAYFIGSIFVGGTFAGFQVYSLFFPQEIAGGGFFGFDLSQIVISIVVMYIFFLIAIFCLFGDKFKWRWIGVFLLPILWFVIQFDLSHFWFYILVALVGWGIGFVLNKLFSRTART